MMNYPVSVFASSPPASAATLFSIARPDVRDATRSGSMASGRRRPHARRRRSSSAGSPGDNPAEERQLDHKAITVKELCDLYLATTLARSHPGKGGRPKKPTTIVTDTGRIHRHIIPLIGTRRVKDLTKADINKVLKDIMAGKTRVSVKTKKLRGKAIVRGGAGTATRTVGLLGGILTYAVEAGIIEHNPAHGMRKPKDNVRTRRLTEAEYRTLGEMLRKAAEDEKYHDDRRDHSTDRAYRLSSQRDHHSHVDRGRYGGQLPAAGGQQGRHVHCSVGLPVVATSWKRAVKKRGTIYLTSQILVDEAADFG